MDPGEAAYTFLLTDIEDSTGFWERNPDGMRAALATHDALFREAIASAGGSVVKGLGDGFLAVFPDPGAGVAAVAQALVGLLDQQVPLLHSGPKSVRVRAALHTGPAERRDGDYFGPTLNLLARMVEAAQPGQTLLSAEAARRLGDPPADLSVADLGTHQLRGVAAPEHLFQLLHPRLTAPNGPPATHRSLLHNLPAPLTTFVGRERELRTLKEQLERGRLITLTGPGGAGKTRLALQLAFELDGPVPDGVWLVELAAVSDPAFLAATVAEALRLRERPSQSLRETLRETLGEKQLLLILDNCEHLVEEVASLAAFLLSAAPRLRVLCTSREPLDIPGERLHDLRPLEVPSATRQTNCSQLQEYDSVRLFVERAQLRQPDFELGPANAASVVKICRSLDGLPLAIELAAARVRHFSVDQIAERVDDALALLAGSARGVDLRQRTLRSLIDWSYELLTTPEKLLLRRLSVFSGGCSLDGARGVCAGADLPPGDVEELLQRLQERSLAQIDSTGAETRFEMLETVRQYARERLVEAGEAHERLDRHAEFYLGLAQAADGELQGTAQQEWLSRLEGDYGNLRSALEWSLHQSGSDPGAAETPFRFAVALWRFWWMRGYLGEGRLWLERALALAVPVSDRLRARAETGAGSLAWFQGDYESARRHHQASLVIWSSLGDAAGVASATNNLAMVLFAQDDLCQARTLFEETAAAYRSLAQPLKLAQSLCNLGRTATLLGDYRAAQPAVAESLALFARLGDRVGEGNALYNQGNLRLATGDEQGAREVHEKALRLRLEVSDPLGLINSLETLAHLMLNSGRPGEAAQLTGAVEWNRRETGVPRTPQEADAHDQVRDQLQQQLGAAELDRLLAAGAEPSFLEDIKQGRRSLFGG